MLTPGQYTNQHKWQFIDKFEYESQHSSNYIYRHFEDSKEYLGFSPGACATLLIGGHDTIRSIDVTYIPLTNVKYLKSISVKAGLIILVIRLANIP